MLWHDFSQCWAQTACASTFLSGVGGILQGLGSIAAFVAIAISLLALDRQRRTDERQRSTEHYREVDEMYFQLLCLVLHEPKLGKPAQAMADPLVAEKYPAYAFMMWNFLETVSDRCDGDAELEVTWQRVLETEGLLHKAWFNDAKNREPFKDSFVTFMNAGGFPNFRNASPMRGQFALNTP
jgi:hypothetical protein